MSWRSLRIVRQDGLASGQVGTVVEVYPPDAFEVEFLDSEGHTISLLTLKRSEFLLLRHEPVSQAYSNSLRHAAFPSSSIASCSPSPLPSPLGTVRIVSKF